MREWVCCDMHSYQAMQDQMVSESTKILFVLNQSYVSLFLNFYTQEAYSLITVIKYSKVLGSPIPVSMMIG